IWHQRGLTRQAQNDAAGALSDLSQALALTPRAEAATLLYDRAGIRVMQGDWAGAIPDYDQALQINPIFLVAYVSRGNAPYDKRDRLAFADFLRAFRLNAARYAREIIRIVAEDLQRDPRAVFDNCNNHLRGNPNDPVAWSRRGLSHLLLNQVEAATADLQR